MTKRVLSVALVGFVLRVVVTFSLPAQPFSDFEMYFRMANSLAVAGNLKGIAAMHPPGYSILLAIVFVVVPGVDHVLLAKLTNCFLGAVTIIAASAVARRFWGEAAGFAAALIMAFFPRQLVMPSLLASENLFTPLLFVFIFLVAEVWQREDALSRAALTGAVIGALTLTRSVAYYIGAVWLLAAAVSRIGWRRVARELALIVLVQHAVLLPWALRNKADVGRFTFLTTSGGMALSMGNNDNATGLWYEGWLHDFEAAHPGITKAPAAEIDAVAKREAFQWILRNPHRAFELYLKKFGLIFAQDGLAAEWTTNENFWKTPSPTQAPGDAGLERQYSLVAHRELVAAVERYSAWAILLGGVVGAVGLLRRRAAPPQPQASVMAVSILGTLAYIPGLSALVAVNGRYRWPIEDLAVLLAALAVAGLFMDRDAPAKSRGTQAAAPTKPGKKPAARRRRHGAA